MVWEDTINENIDQIVDELANIANYASEASNSLISITEAFSSRKFRDKLDENFKILQNSVQKEEIEENGKNLR